MATRGLLLLDFDGTLAPIVRKPKEALIPPDIMAALLDVIHNPKWKVAIVSGRSLKDVRRKVGLKELIYSGNHGYEIQFPGQKPIIHPIGKSSEGMMRSIFKTLHPLLASLPGVMLENKKYTLGLHTRQASRTDERMAHVLLREAVKPFLRRKQVLLKRGKKVLEVWPAGPWNKGHAVRYILRSLDGPRLPVYVGDDNTDEDAFEALHDIGVTARVGHGETRAKQCIPSTKDMPAFLKSLDRLI